MGTPLASDFRVLAKLITKIENDRYGSEDILRDLYKENSETIVIGITGPPGAGKSSLTDRIIKEYRNLGKNVGVVAVDPSSPFTGGAILGDRIRMCDHATDPGVFIRSMGSRGSLGGLAPATIDVLNLMKSAGFDVLIVETVGVGQSEIDVMSIADTVLLVLVPGMGDDVQALKAGIMEIADIFVINKADKDGKERLAAELNMIINLNRHRLEWEPPVVETVATENKGTVELMEKIRDRGMWLKNKGVLAKKDKIINQFKQMALDRIGANILAILNEQGMFTRWSGDLMNGKTNPYQAMKELDEMIKIEWGKK
ncbi:MAG TPA: methylmalonyl Co-A mutase-associated GTPase MeaB [bacterium]|jgi:LAO/AO transport system kinase|nr:methylmalonyl Co-A mutase-associated GTPase MeaB [bacterium]MDX9806184.1 methylmalonyl Co-A mutase-associated GTPase MeaB [bacterium]HQB11319.1 methylmalonyl Co-A mutase-associated GTPase MeaB [bacterium]